MPRPATATAIVATVSALLALSLAPARAQNLNGDDLILSGEITQNGSGENFFNGSFSSFNGSSCFGNSCTNSESNGLGNPPMKLKWSSQVAIIMEDTSTSAFADRDWRIGTGGIASQEIFFITDEGSDWTDNAEVTPFTIVGGAPENAFWIDDTGNVGLGTSMPQANLHIAGTNVATIQLEDTSGSTGAWNVTATSTGFWVYDDTNSKTPLAIEANTPNNTLWLDDTGNVGLGTFTPDAPLELSGTDSFNFFRITATDAAINESVDIVFTEGPLGTGQLRYNIVDGDNQEMSLDADGNMVLDGTLTTAGPTCSGGCDAVFDPDYDLPGITEHAAEMYRLGHLPGVGPTEPGAPINMSEQYGRLLNELEHAHIYIEELHEDNAAQAAQIASLSARLDALEGN